MYSVHVHVQYYTMYVYVHCTLNVQADPDQGQLYNKIYHMKPNVWLYSVFLGDDIPSGFDDNLHTETLTGMILGPVSYSCLA